MATETATMPEIGPMESQATGRRRAAKKVLAVEELLPKAVMWEDSREALAMSRAAIRKLWKIDDGADEMGDIIIGDVYQQPQPSTPAAATSKLSETAAEAKRRLPGAAGLLGKALLAGSLLGGGGIVGAVVNQVFNSTPAPQEFTDTDTHVQWQLDLVD